MLRPDEFAILAWGGTGGNQEVFDGIRECGFNLAGFVDVKDLDKVAKAGLKCFVRDEKNHVGTKATQDIDDAEIERRARSLVERANGHQAVYGYYLRDEPTSGLFPQLGKWVEAYKKADPSAVPYMNLFPIYVQPENLLVKSYAEYLDKFVEVTKPKFISYDNYSLTEDVTLRPGYFPNLEEVRTAGLRHNLPFYNCILCNSHFEYPEPSPTTLRFQVYTSLAYGARGISYFTYFTPPAGNYRLAPIDQFGHKTPTWDMLRNVNLQIHALGPVYITLKSINVFHCSDIPSGSQGIESSKLLKTIEGKNLMVGEFEGPDGQPFVMVVNKSLEKSTSFHVEFKKDGEIQQVNSYTGNIDRWGGENCWLAAGQGMLLGLGK